MKMKRPLKVLKISLFIAFLGGFFYFFFFSPFFKINQWQVKGEKFLEKKVILETIKNLSQKRIWGIFSRENFFTFLLAYSSFAKELKERFPEIQDLRVAPLWQKKSAFFHTLGIAVQERERLGIWCNPQKKLSSETKLEETEQNCYYFDKQGFLFKKAPQTKGPFLLVVRNDSEMTVGLKQTIQDKKLLDALLYLKEGFDKQTQFLLEEIRKISLLI